MGVIERVVRRLLRGPGLSLGGRFGFRGSFLTRHRVRDADEAERVAAQLAGRDREAALRYAAQLRELLARGGTTLLLVLERRGPVRVEFVPSARHHLRLRTRRGTLSARVEEPAPSGAWIRPGFRRVPALHHLPQSEPSVVVFAAVGAVGRRFRVLVPGYLSHATVVANGRVRLRAEPLGGVTGARVLRIR